MIPGLVAHLWQSTLFAGVAWLLTLALRKNPAQVRHRIWFIASVKFLIPFSLLVGLGTLVPWHAATPPIHSGWMTEAEQIAQPLTAFPIVTARVAAMRDGADRNYFAASALALWVCGFAAIAICWVKRWRRVQVLQKSAELVRMEFPVAVMSADGLIEPGIFGIFRPVLLLPEGIEQRIDSAQLDAILAHELCHIRRHDNLTAAIHMAVQAIFWFHPLVWWLGARLVDERERACDEEVLRLGSKPQIYAAGILNVCRLYTETPLVCVSGVTGADLKKRIEAIMKNRGELRVNLTKKVALAVAGVAALAVPIIIGALNGPAILAQAPADWQARAGGNMTFEVASVKLSKGEFVPPNIPLNFGEAYSPTGGYFRADFPLSVYIEFAYKIWPTEDQEREMFAHSPKWVTTDRYSIDARSPGNPTKDQMRLMVQSLLADRFKMATHFETHEGPVLALTSIQAGKLGPKLIPHADGPSCDKPGSSPGAGSPDGFPPGCGSFAMLRMSGGALMLTGSRDISMDMLAASLAHILGQGRTVIDRTGLTGKFDFTLEWAPDPLPSDSPAAPQTPAGPTSLQALRDELGLKVESTRGPVQVLVVDAVERPSDN